MADQSPFVSILIPIRNEAAYIERCLDAVLSQNYPTKQMEILVADGLSDDGTREILEDYSKSNPCVKIFDNLSKIVPPGLNTLIKHSKGEIIIRVDGHTIIQPDYVKQCVLLLQATDADNVGGRMDAIGKQYFGKAVAIATSTPFGVGGARFHYSEHDEWVDTVYLGAWRREVFTKIGLFDEELVRNQDDEFNYRLRKFGGKILLSQLIKSSYTPRESIIKLWQQYFQYGFYKVRVLQKHPAQMRPRQFVPFAFVLSIILGLFLSIFFPWGWIPLASLVGVYLLSNLAASIITAKNKGWRYLPVLPFTFATMHLSYGLGFLAGLFKYWNRWKENIGVMIDDIR
ncbi:MAG: glycosyltransferase family 2 protein [Anaerolineaceae bacterium]